MCSEIRGEIIMEENGITMLTYLLFCGNGRQLNGIQIKIFKYSFFFFLVIL